jgi:hypothetical protein
MAQKEALDKNFSYVINLRCLYLFVFILALSGCANKVLWSETEGKAILIDYGHHSSLILQDGDGVYWEYTYGDWEWFAMNRSQWWRLPVTLLLPTKSTLARGEYSDKNVLNDHLNRFVIQRFNFAVSSIKAQALVKELNEKFQKMRDSHKEVYQPCVSS